MLSKWSPPTLVPYMVALLCMGPCHGQAHTRDPTIGFSPPALLYLSSSYFQCLMQIVSLFSSVFLCYVKHFAVSRIQTLILFFSLFLYTSWIAAFTLTGDQVALRKLFIVGGLYMFIAQRQHVVQPKGQELTFSKCLCRLLFLCGFSCVEGGGEVLEAQHCILSYCCNYYYINTIQKIWAAQFLWQFVVMKLWTWCTKWLSWHSGHYSVPW